MRRVGDGICIRVPLQPIRIAGSWGYLAGSWREARPHLIVILISIREDVTIMSKVCLIHWHEINWYQNYNR